MYPVVAIIGKPNTGKSTLFNYLIGEQKAITAREAGTTRDRIYAKAYLKGKKWPYILVDTGGIELTKEGLLEDKMVEQAHLAIREADVIVFLLDSREELTRDDYDAAQIVRKSGKRVLLVASKCDNLMPETGHFLELGFGAPHEISVFHYFGTDELQELLREIFTQLSFKPVEIPAPQDDDIIRIAFVGRPNTGKSSLLNAFFEQDRVIVSDIPGTTRDATELDFEYDGRKFALIDTAGIRKRGAIEPGLEKFSVARSLESLDRADIAVLLLDAIEGITQQDMHIADYILKRKTGLIIAVNKLDLLEKGEEARDIWLNQLRYKFDFTPWASVVFVSAKNRKNIFHILDVAKTVYAEREKRIPTGELNAFLLEATMKHGATGSGNKIPKTYYMTQVETHPPHFIIFVNNEEWFHFSYARYIENRLREKYGFAGTPVKLEFRSKGE